MPIYEYRCTECREEFETYVAGHATAVACRACASPNVTRKLSVFGLRAAGSFTPSSTMSTGGCCGGGATPTHAGRLLLGYARRMLALQREAQQALDQFQGRMSGELIVGGSTIPGEYVLPALIGRFKGKYPDISICLLIGSSRQVTEWVEAGRAEVGVVGAPPGPKTLLARELMADELVLVVPAGHAWTNRKTVTLADVRREPLIVREQGSGSREALERALDQADTDLSAF